MAQAPCWPSVSAISLVGAATRCPNRRCPVLDPSLVPARPDFSARWKGLSRGIERSPTLRQIANRFRPRSPFASRSAVLTIFVTHEAQPFDIF